jgi:hypothetical protein
MADNVFKKLKKDEMKTRKEYIQGMMKMINLMIDIPTKFIDKNKISFEERFKRFNNSLFWLAANTSLSIE